jgi:hypothetical protein
VPSERTCRFSSPLVVSVNGCWTAIVKLSDQAGVVAGTSPEFSLLLNCCQHTAMVTRFVLGLQLLLLCISLVRAVETYPGAFHSKPSDCETPPPSLSPLQVQEISLEWYRVKWNGCWCHGHDDGVCWVFQCTHCSSYGIHGTILQTSRTTWQDGTRPV